MGREASPSWGGRLDRPVWNEGVRGRPAPSACGTAGLAQKAVLPVPDVGEGRERPGPVTRGPGQSPGPSSTCGCWALFLLDGAPALTEPQALDAARLPTEATLAPVP